MIRNFRMRAGAVVYVACAGLTACADQAPTTARQPAVIYVHPPKAPQVRPALEGLA
ncbi:putative lipoprotein [Burkholderia pseudomallei]|nr:putative lipoprotein [Burkholderia pseudomallei]